MLTSGAMLQDADDQEPVTRREVGAPALRGLHYCVEIAYREPTYSLYSGTEKIYGGSYQVWAADARSAIAEARARFEAEAAASGVGWGRVIVGIVCRPL